MGLENIDEQFHFPSPHVLTVLRRWPVPAIFLVSQGLTGRLHTKTADCPGSLSIAVAAKAMQAGGKSLFGGEAAVVPGNMQKPEGKWRLGGERWRPLPTRSGRDARSLHPPPDMPPGLPFDGPPGGAIRRSPPGCGLMLGVVFRRNRPGTGFAFQAPLPYRLGNKVALGAYIHHGKY